MNPFREALEGWTENEWAKGYGAAWSGACLVGRIIRASDYCRDYADALAHVVQELFPDRTFLHRPTSPEGIVAGFNDHKETTWSDVVQVLEKAAVRWDEQL